jgi:dihydrodipicolinate synthase/N-acetylneuraminate lyase
MTTFSSLDRRQFLGALTATAAVAATLSVPDSVRAATAAPPRRIAGVFPIGFTPIVGKDQVDYDGLASQIRFCRKGGVHGFAWPQLASGWSTLSEAERLKGAEAICDAAKGGSTAIIIGIQSKTADLKESGRYARQAEKLGADGLICIPPPGMTAPAELLDYYTRVAALTPLPFMAQAIGDFSVDLLVRMYEKIPNFRFVKDESGEPLDRIAEIRQRTGDKLKSFSGRGVATMITEMERGFAGHCPYVSLADVYSSAYDDFHAGNKRKAYDTFGKILASNSLMPQNDVNILIARGVLKPGTTTRQAPPAPGAPPPKRVRITVEEVRRVLDTYLKADLRA